MKRFKDLNVGDIIYYYDHCKMHPQVVNDIKIVEIPYLTWRNTPDFRETIILQAGNSPVVQLDWIADESMAAWDYMTRFSCKEAAQQYLDNLKDKAKRKIDKSIDILYKYNNLLKEYDFSFD